MVPVQARRLIPRRQILDSLLKNLAVDCWRCRLSSPSDDRTATEALAIFTGRAFTGHWRLMVEVWPIKQKARRIGVAICKTRSSRPGSCVNSDMVCDQDCLRDDDEYI